MRHAHFSRLFPVACSLGVLAGAGVLPACSAHRHAGEPDALASVAPPAPIEPVASRILTSDEVAALFATDEGRDTLRALDERDPRILYDGGDRFVQITTTMSAVFGRVPSLTMHCGWMGQAYAVPRGVMLAGARHEDIRLAFTDDALLVTIGPGADAPGGARAYTIAWPRGEMSQWGWVDLETGDVALLPER